MNTCFPTWTPVAGVASITWSCILLITYLVPLQWPLAGLRFLSNIIGHFFFSFSTWGGIPGGQRVCKSSSGYLYWLPSSRSLSLLLYSLLFPGNWSIIWLLTSSAAQIVRTLNTTLLGYHNSHNSSSPSNTKWHSPDRLSSSWRSSSSSQILYSPRSVSSRDLANDSVSPPANFTLIFPPVS